MSYRQPFGDKANLKLMDKKRPVDLMRERGGSANIGTLEDGTIMETLNLSGRVLFIKERSVYEFRLADDIDPNRENPNLPPSSHRLIVNLGTESEIFSRTFLTAKRLFKAEFLPSTIDVTQSLFLTLEIVQELAALEKEIADYLSAEKKLSNEYEDRKNKKLDHATPSIPDIKTRCKTIFQKADQALQAQIDLIRIFYPNFSKTSYYKSFFEFIQTEYGEQDDFTKFFQKILPFILLVRNIRNCLDHRRTETEIKDFELQINANIISPTIEVNYLDSKMQRTSIAEFLPIVTQNLVMIFETTIAYLCSKQSKPNKIFPSEVMLIPEERRINKNIRYAYWSPLGEGGYFHQ